MTETLRETGADTQAQAERARADRSRINDIHCRLHDAYNAPVETLPAWAADDLRWLIGRVSAAQAAADAEALYRARLQAKFDRITALMAAHGITAHDLWERVQEVLEG